MTVGRFRLTSMLVAAAGIAVVAAGLPAIAHPGASDAAPPPDAARAAAPAAGTVSGGPQVRLVKPSEEMRRSANEAVAAMVAEFNARMAAKLKGEEGAPAADAVVMETLPSGLRRARLPVDRINVTVARVGADGRFTNVCTESPQQAATLLLARPLATSSSVEN